MSNDVNNYFLSEVVDFRQGYPFRGGIPDENNGSVRVVQLKNVTQGNLKFWDSLLRTEIKSSKEPYWLRDNDVVFAARGTSNVAAVAIGVPPSTVCSPHLYVFRVKAGIKMLPEFLAWQLNQQPAQKYLAQVAEGTHQLSIRRTELEQLQIRIPSIAQQRSIIELDRVANAERQTLQALIENRKAELSAIAEMLLG